MPFHRAGATDVFFGAAGQQRPLTTGTTADKITRKAPVVLPILHRRRAAGLVALPLFFTASLALGGCSQGGSPEPAAGAAITAAAGGATAAGATDPATTSGATEDPGTTKASGAGTKPSESAPPDFQQGGPKTVVVMVKGKAVEPKPGTVKVKKGDPLLLVVITDKDGEVHIHGVDIEKSTKAGQPTQIPLTFDEAGSYEVELHDPALLLTKIVVS